MSKASGSTLRLVERLANDPAMALRIARRHYGFNRRDLHPRRFVQGSGVGH